MVIAEQKTQLNILLIEDDSVDGESITRSLHKAFPDCDVRRATCLGDALAAVNESSFDAVLADLSLPDSRGLDSVVSMVQACPQNPLIVLTGHADDELSLTAIAEGAQDYLVKGRINPELLQRSIRYAIQRHAMARNNDQLLQTLRERDLLLQTKNKKLEKACRTAQKFVDNVSHEFRTPLTVIMEYASLLEDGIAGPVSEEQAKLLGVIDDRASDLNNMVDDMLDVSKLESGLLGASRSQCTVADIIEHVLPAIRRKAVVRNVRLELQVEDDLPDVFCDSAKVGRVIVNLAINAIKFTRNPGHVVISARRHGETDVSIAVTDNGVGIPIDRQCEIFNRFAQVKTEVRDSTKGFGLGLNIAQELVEINFGKMDVESTEGVGSTFSFTLPVNRPDEVTRRFVDRLAEVSDGPQSVSAIRATLQEDASESAVLDVERFLVHILRQNDLIFPLPHRQWLLLVSVPEIALEEFLARLDKERQQINRNRPRGPLPDFRIDVEGTWDVARHARDVVNMVNQQLDQEKYCVA